MMLVVGVDAGGTASRAVVATTDGTVVGRGSAGPGNPTSAGGPAAAKAIGTAVRTALGPHDPARVLAGTAGVAGVAVLSDPAIAAAFDDEWTALGLTCPFTVTGDAVTAFAAGVPSPGGAVLIAGTGAVAARIENWHIRRTADGLGWLLGDEGSGHWLGLQAVRATARAWAATAAAPPPGLAAAIAAHAGAATCDDLITWAVRRPPSAFAALAPLVCAHDDPLAVRLTTEAAARLIATLHDLGPPGGPVVLAGGLLTGDTRIRAEVLAALPGVATARDPAAAAAWLALRRTLDLDAGSAADLHRRMLAQEGPVSGPR
ncbi:N-acetylglucosamine kinase [Nucisporomicrobium flavum]|uniref:N-acetylglucosamine kinase n=1 Tax=Nucisporomicrobium flavum TaxID=2785915 RepID=UPI0018F40B25|nr:BadF/BadG/BcrA/BcrD ATPase family protein [Nucisporomicrobium flavum]